MRKKILLVIALIFAIYSNSSAQGIELGFQTGYGFYNMNTIKNISNETFNQLPFEAKIISNCPPYLYYQPRITFPHSNMSFGFLYTFQSTGARISSKDYSGEYKFDTKMYSNSPGVIVNIYLVKNKCIFGIYSELGMNFTKLKFDEYLKVDTIINDQVYSFTSNSFYLKPGLNIIYPLNKFSIEFNVGYYKEFFRQDISNGQSKILVKKDFFDIDIWDGLRTGFVLSYSLSKKN